MVTYFFAEDKASSVKFWRFIGVKGRESSVLWTLIPQKPKILLIGEHATTYTTFTTITLWLPNTWHET